MLILEGNKIQKSYGDRLIIDIDNVKIYSEDRIGVVGLNGAGKTTLMDILSGRAEPDEGIVKIYGSCSYITQLDIYKPEALDKHYAKLFGTNTTIEDTMSGGEKTRFKLAQCFNKNSNIIFADEPTSNLDISGITLLEEKFLEYKGAVVVISHDRQFLDKLCNKILEVEDGSIKIYNGNYSDYRAQKNRERERAEFEYHEYVSEKARLEEVIDEKKQKVKTMKKAPSRMGNSEARLHKMGNQKAKANLERAVKNIQSRIEHLEVKEKPKYIEKTKVDIQPLEELHSKILISGEKINKSFGKKVILNNAEFKIFNGSKTAFIGDNGSGKSTLIKMIMAKDSQIKSSGLLRIGYFSQELDILDGNLSIHENIIKNSVYDETRVRIVLARLMFKNDDIYKKVSVLSGGERVKAAFAKIFLQDINLLILDEPTNYLDIYSTEAIEDALGSYEGTVLFVSHDRKFIDVVADHILLLEDKKLLSFNGNYQEYLDAKNKKNASETEKIKQKMILENRLSELIGRLSMPSKKDNVTELDAEYKRVLQRLREL